MSLTDPMTVRLTRDLEPVLSLADPRAKLSAYHDMPYATDRDRATNRRAPSHPRAPIGPIAAGYFGALSQRDASSSPP